MQLEEHGFRMKRMGRINIGLVLGGEVICLFTSTFRATSFGKHQSMILLYSKVDLILLQ